LSLKAGKAGKGGERDMTESMPPTRVQLQKLRKDLSEKVLDKACNDPQWKQQLIEDPELAMREANFPELQQLQQASQLSAEVHGQSVVGGYSDPGCSAGSWTNYSAPSCQQNTLFYGGGHQNWWWFFK
jgi:hypothetical protein